MAYTHKRFIQESHRTLLLCVDSYEQKRLQGRLYHCTLEKPSSFSNLMQLLLLVEQLTAALSYPAPAKQRRLFKNSESAPFEPPVCDEPGDETGRLATFRVRILFQQNASWQGTVSWLEGGCEETFRSALELTMLVDSALMTPIPCGAK